MIYLDNAATSFPKPQSVYQAVDTAFRRFGANPGRGGHRMALDAGRVVFDAREALAGFFKVKDASRIAFTSGATEAINLALFGLLKAGDRVVTSTMEHNAVIRPLRALQDRGVQVVKVPADARGFVNPQAVFGACSEKTRMVVLTHCSNVTGTRQPVEEIGPWCRKNGILFLVDAAQSAGIFDIDVQAMGIDLLAAPGHKGLMGPQGTGFLYMREGVNPAPLIYGGTGTHSQSELMPEEFPERYESGTLNTPGLAGLHAGVQFLLSEGMTSVRQRERELMAHLIEGLKDLDGVRLYGPTDVQWHGGALSINIEGADAAEIGFMLDRKHDIFVRVGLHCAPDAHRTIGSLPRGTIRISPGYFTTHEEIDRCIAAVASLSGGL